MFIYSSTKFYLDWMKELEQLCEKIMDNIAIPLYNSME